MIKYADTRKYRIVLIKQIKVDLGYGEIKATEISGNHSWMLRCFKLFDER